MRNLTARERAQAVIAQVRAEYPCPRRADDESGLFGDWYCVGVAVRQWCMHRGLHPKGLLDSVAELNDAGRFEEAWARAEDILCDYFTTETREREEEVT